MASQMGKFGTTLFHHGITLFHQGKTLFHGVKLCFTMVKHCFTMVKHSVTMVKQCFTKFTDLACHSMGNNDHNWTPKRWHLPEINSELY